VGAGPAVDRREGIGEPKRTYELSETTRPLPSERRGFGQEMAKGLSHGKKN